MKKSQDLRRMNTDWSWVAKQIRHFIDRTMHNNEGNMNIKIRYDKIGYPAIVGLIIGMIYVNYGFFLISYMARSLGPVDFANYIGDSTLIREIMGISVSLFIGIVTYYLCYKKEGTVIERFISGIFFPFIFGVFITPILVLFPSVLYGIEIVQNSESPLNFILSSWIVGIFEILCGSVLMHFIIIRKSKQTA